MPTQCAAVSYTHLDVYKRQAILLLALVLVLALVPLVLSPGAAFGGSDDEGSQVVEQIPVSYTHLSSPPLGLFGRG